MGHPLGELILFQRERRSLTRTELALLVRNAAKALGEPVGTDHKTVARWETKGLIPMPLTIRALASIFELPVERLVIAAKQQQERVKGSAMPMLGPALAEPSDVELIHATSQRLVALEMEFGGNEVASLAVRCFRSVQRQIAGHPSGQTRELQAATAELAEVAGWLLHDADQQEAARAMNNEALFMTRLAGDTSMELLILANASLMALFTHQPGEALAIASRVLEAGKLTGRERVIFTLRAARGLAQLGDRSAALRRLSEAEASFWDGATAADPAWAWWVDPGEVTAHVGLAHAEFGNPARAAELLQRAVESCPPRRRGALYIYLAQQLRASIEAGAWRDAESVIEQISPYITEVGSARTAGLVVDAARLVRASAAPPSLRDAVRHLDERLASTL
jgi:tetratricopeptide (TPR) repeat protein